MLNVISMGVGLNSVVMSLAAAEGEITPMPDFAIFSNTGWEGKATYRTLEWIKPLLPFPVYTVHASDIHSDHLLYHDKRTTMPFRLNDGVKKSRAMQKCTQDYKAIPIERKMKEMIREAGLCKHRLPSKPVISQWRGITTDEAHRMKPASEPWYETRFPLIMDLSMSRGECIIWLNKRGYPIPQRSSCVGCPNHSNEEWRNIKNNRPKEWAEAVEFDKVIRKSGGLNMPAFLHSDGVPLDEADLSEDSTIDMFGNDCLGMCGV